MKPANQQEKLCLFASAIVDIACAQSNEGWTRKELDVQVEYVVLHWDGARTSGWPGTKRSVFRGCAAAVEQSMGWPKQTGKPYNMLLF